MSDPTETGRSLVEFSLDRPPTATIADWIAGFYQLFAAYQSRGVDPVLFYHANEDTIYIADPPNPPRAITSHHHFFGEIHNIVNFTRAVDNRVVSTALDWKQVPLFFSSSSRRLLPPLTSVVHEPALYRTQSGELKMLHPGYNAFGKEGIYFWNRHGREWTPREKPEHLLTCFSGVPFERIEYKANVVAALLGAVVIDRRIESPLLAVTSNQPGVGKTKLTASIGYILTGYEPAPVNYHGNELDKDIGMRFKQNHRFILIDNVETKDGRAFRSDRLAMHLTQGHSKSVRELGFSRSIDMKGVLFALTQNNCELSEDLAVRALPIRLFRVSTGPMHPFVWDYAIKHRFEIYEELLGLAMKKDLPDLSLEGYVPEFRFREWLKFVLPRLRTIEEFKDIDLSLVIASGASFDEALLDLGNWAMEMTQDGTNEFVFGAPDLLIQLDVNKSMYQGINGIIKGRNDHAKKINLGLWLTQSVGKRVILSDGSVVKLVRAADKGPVKKYRFEIEKKQVVVDDDPIPEGGRPTAA